jgi:menaquinone-dependent protoporphyrinogen oxidase
MRVLVAYASRAGSTRGIAEFIGGRLKERGLQVDICDVDSARDLAGYDAFVIGSAVYMFHWLKGAKRFVSQNSSTLARHPVWLFSSGPTGRSRTDKKGRDLREVSGPSEIDGLCAMVNPRDHRVFFGALYRDRVKGGAGMFARFIRKEDEGDFRDWNEIGGWADSIAEALPMVPA